MTGVSQINPASQDGGAPTTPFTTTPKKGKSSRGRSVTPSSMTTRGMTTRGSTPKHGDLFNASQLFAAENLNKARNKAKRSETLLNKTEDSLKHLQNEQRLNQRHVKVSKAIRYIGGGLLGALFFGGFAYPVCQLASYLSLGVAVIGSVKECLVPSR